jgi:hypothetical protein
MALARFHWPCPPLVKGAGEISSHHSIIPAFHHSILFFRGFVISFLSFFSVVPVGSVREIFSASALSAVAAVSY